MSFRKVSRDRARHASKNLSVAVEKTLKIPIYISQQPPKYLGEMVYNNISKILAIADYSDSVPPVLVWYLVKLNLFIETE
jgi:hypothetical protein